ncbi:hypothetical protein HZA38_04660 [Candidatus Peregrinibacteria bacterium]|nr:hypothetical protein [Candidatus Peregrinibacteria bacterium]
MKKLLIAAGILFVASGFALLEYFFFPNRVVRLEASLNPQTQEKESLPNFFRVQSGDTSVSEVSEKNFEFSGIPGILRKESEFSNHLFGLIRIDPENDGLAVLKTDFFENGKDVVLVRVYEIFPTDSTTMTKAFLELGEKFDQKFAGDIESSVNHTDSYGLSSLYVNPSSHPEKVFLVVSAKDRILGFEYLKENNEKLVPFIQNLAPSQKSEESAGALSANIL